MKRTWLVLVMIGSLCAACHHVGSPRGADAGLRSPDTSRSIDAGEASAMPTEFGPPNPWGDGSLPRSNATGPEVDRTMAAMTALRASIGFWRIERSMRDRCPTLDDLAHTPRSGFDPATMRADAWGEPFEVECQGARVRVHSLGPDHARNSADDLWAQ